MGRLQDAEKSVRRLSSKSNQDNARDAVALMVETTKLEETLTAEARYIDCFRGSNLWRTEIGCVAWLSQVLVGFAITSYAAYFFEQAGLPTADAYKMTVGQGGLHILFVILSCFLSGKVGRRKIFIGGAIWMACMWLIIGCMGTAKQGITIGYASAAVYLLWFIGYELTIGPVAFIIVSFATVACHRIKLT
jgi:SP family general alpha glucoside:H+ symporter-like MFS transporter